MMKNLFGETFQILKRNTGFVLAVFVWWLLSNLEDIPDLSIPLLLVIRLTKLFLVLYLYIFAVAVVLVEKGLINNTEPPSTLAYKFIGKSLVVAVVSVFWLFLILAIPYSVVNYFENSVSGLLAQALGAIKFFAIGFLIFGAFTLVIAISMSQKAPISESPARGLMEIYKNFSYYLKSLVLIAVIGYLPDIMLAILIPIANVDKNTAFEQFSNFPSSIVDMSASVLLFMLIHQFAFITVNLLQRIAMVLVYTNRPKNTEEKGHTRDLVLRNS